jgi:hypothetical protein
MKGVKDLEKYRKDFKPLSPKRAIWAFCADCMGLYFDKIKDCKNKNCPLYPHMPGNKSKKGIVLGAEEDD